MAARSFDVAVIGAGVFGAWTAYWLRRAGLSVTLVDAHGPGNSRASSGGETRILRIGYGSDEIYSRWALRALGIWKQFAEEAGEPLFHPTGVLWLADDADDYTKQSYECARRAGAKVERLTAAQVNKRWPQIAVDDVTWAAFEPQSGVLMARRAVTAVVTNAEARGVIYGNGEVATAKLSGRVTTVRLRGGESIRAGAFVFACGPWLPRLFPEILGKRMHITRQEAFFFGVPAGATEYRAPNLPTWLFHRDDFYGMPDIENRGVKLASDRHGPAFDPEIGSRLSSAKAAEEARVYLGRRFPGLKDAPIVEARVCQYENSSNGDFILDRHPDCENVWIAGGGSGHGFKHGPVAGEYCAALVTGKATPEPRFALLAKPERQKRAVY
jgi:monomeric sarcosine oxidase